MLQSWSSSRPAPWRNLTPVGLVLALSVAMVLAACSGSDDDGGATTEDASAPAQPEETPDDDGSLPVQPEEVTGEDGSISVQINPDNVLSAIVRVETDAPTRAGLTATSDGHEVALPAADETSEEHELPLVGLRPETTYEVQVDAVGDDEEPVDAGGSVSFTSGALPGNFPPIDVEADADRTAEGLTLLSLKPWGPPADAPPEPEQDEDGVAGYLAAVDQEGHVVWYHPTELGVLDARQVEGGNFVFTYDEVVVREIDVLGRPVNELAGRVATEVAPRDLFDRARATEDATTMDTDSAHHDAGPIPNGNILLLSTELEELSGPPQCDEGGDEVTYPVISDVVAEVDPDTGEVVGEWPLADIYDPFERPGEELCVEGLEFAPPNYFYPVDDVRDWTHGNSVMLDEERNALVVSLRHLNAVLAIRYQDDADGSAGELIWEIGPDGTLPLEGEPSYYQHAAEVLDDREVLVYDNGNSRDGAAVGVEGDDPPYSRAVIYEVDDSSDDPDDWSARQVWEHVLEGDDGEDVFTAFLGDVDELENGNVLVSHGAITDERGNLNARVIEVIRDGDDDGEVVLDLRVGDDSSGWTVYRSERISSLTPDA